MTELQQSSYRYVNLVLFVLASLSNAVAPSAFTAIAPITSQLYGVSELLVNMNNMMYAIMFPIMVFPSNYIIEKYGLKVGTLFGETFMIVGLLVRLLINYHFYFMVIGTFITGFGFTYMLNAPNKFAVTWFPTRQIGLINSVCIFSIFASDAICAFSSAIFLTKNSTKSDFWNFFAIESGIVIFVLTLMVIFFKGKPKHPPNYSSAAERDPYFVSFKKLIRNKNYWKIFMSMTALFSTLNVFFAAIAWIFKPFGYEGMEAGIVLVLSNVGGFTGCLITGYVFGTKNYKRNSIIYVYIAIFSLSLIWIGLEKHLTWLIYVGAVIAGSGFMPYLTTVSDFASNTAFPVGQSLSAGGVLFGGQVIGFILSIICSVLIFDGKSFVKTRIGMGILLVLLVISASFLHISEQKLNRSEYEQCKALSSQKKSFLTDQQKSDDE